MHRTFAHSTKRSVLRIRDVYPASRILIFTHPASKNSNKREGSKKFVVKPFFVATNFTKFKIILFFKCWKKNLGQFSKNPRSGIRKKPIPYPGSGSRGQKGTGSRIRISNTVKDEKQQIRLFCRNFFPDSKSASNFVFFCETIFWDHISTYILPTLKLNAHETLTV